MRRGIGKLTKSAPNGRWWAICICYYNMGSVAVYRRANMCAYVCVCVFFALFVLCGNVERFCLYLKKIHHHHKIGPRYFFLTAFKLARNWRIGKTFIHTCCCCCCFRINDSWLEIMKSCPIRQRGNHFHIIKTLLNNGQRLFGMCLKDPCWICIAELHISFGFVVYQSNS